MLAPGGQTFIRPKDCRAVCGLVTQWCLTAADPRNNERQCAGRPHWWHLASSMQEQGQPAYRTKGQRKLADYYFPYGAVCTNKACRILVEAGHLGFMSTLGSQDRTCGSINSTTGVGSKYSQAKSSYLRSVARGTEGIRGGTTQRTFDDAQQGQLACDLGSTPSSFPGSRLRDFVDSAQCQILTGLRRWRPLQQLPSAQVHLALASQPAVQKMAPS